MNVIPAKLTPEAIYALAPVMHTGVDLRGRQLFVVSGESCSGYLVLQACGDFVYIAAFVGRGAIALLRYLRDRARESGFKRVEWHSFHRQIPRALREFFVRVTPTDLPGEFRYSFLTGA